VLRTGFVSKKQLQFLYSKAEIFIFPSLYEGFGFPIVEAFSCGCPVISSNTSSIPEVAGNAALLIDPHNGAQLRDAVLSLLANQSRREELRLRGYKQVMKFNWADCAARLLEQVNRSR
jgi:glycosyltransferase involved in cell wall biosynthesis